MKPASLFRVLFWLLVGVALLTRSAVPLLDPVEQVRAYTRSIEFDYIRWTVGALRIKLTQDALGAPAYLPAARQHELVSANIDLVGQIDALDRQIRRVYSDPAVTKPEEAAGDYVQLLERLHQVEDSLKPTSEMVLQEQLSAALSDLGLAWGGQPLPPVLYHSTPLPLALIVSPRSIIQQDANISLVADLSLPEMVELEKQVEQNLNVSALVVPVGGVGVYPTMVMQTSDLDWVIDTVAHEWTHNYLTLRPLGLNYETTPALRTMNETTASIAGSEIGRAVLEKFYPERVTPEPTAPVAPQPAAPATPEPTPAPEPAPFDYRAEMHETRITADALLAQGKIEEAENYLEQRRQFFWDNGYQIRRLNQAYFAFYGAYADVPGGAAGSDPVGPAVRLLRERSASLADFVNRMSWMDSYDDLLQALAEDTS